MPEWFAVRTHPRHEAQVRAVLQQRGVEVFLPQVPTWRRPGSKEARAEPLFPGYLFAHLDLQSTQWLSARSAPGVSYFLGPPGAPNPLPADLIEGMQARTAAFQQNWPPRFQPGDRVLVQHGPLYGLEVVFDGSLSASGRVRVLLQVLNRLVPVEMHVTQLRYPGPAAGYQSA